MAYYRHRKPKPITAGPRPPQLLRLWNEQVTGAPANLAPHELRRIPQKEPASTALRDKRPELSNLRTEGQYSAARSPSENYWSRIFSVEEIKNLLQRHMLKHCVDRSRRVPLKAIAAMADVSPKLLYLIVRGRRRLTESVHNRLSAVFSSLESGELRIFRRGRLWTEKYLTPPDPLPPPQPRLVRAEDFIEWARCRSCGGRRYTRVTLHGAAAEWYLCDGCLWWETAGFGARPVEARRRPRE
jgi:hypothetical protein